MWTCQKCKREFKNANQWHSCVKITVEDHFRDKPEELRASFNYLVELLNYIVPMRIEAVKGQINIATQSVFLAVHPMKKLLRLEFYLADALSSTRVVKQYPFPNGKHCIFVDVTGREDIDDELSGWLKEAADQHLSKI